MSTPVYFAPMEGLTDAVFRRCHHTVFTGVTAYYMPFISPTQNLVLTGREKHNILPEYNKDTPCVPQVLTKDEQHFLWAARMLADMGYTEINLNAGCPSGTVTAKGKGAGILRDVKQLDYFLEDVCAHSPLPVSVKTRIGFSTPEEWAALLSVYAQYPLKALIIHPRTCRERYDPGTIHPDCWQAACETYPVPLVYNGDLFSVREMEALLRRSPEGIGLMLGRGLVAQPAMARVFHGGAALQVAELVRFHDLLVREWSQLYDDRVVMMKLRVVMKHLECCFTSTGRLPRQIRKARTLSELLEADHKLFNTCQLKPEPMFVPDELRETELHE